MPFRIRGLDPRPFASLFALDDAELARRRAVRTVAETHPGYPCRVTLEDATPGTPVILVNHEHLAVEGPYRASHAIYVTPATAPFDATDIVPPALRERLLSVRAFDARGMMVDADLIEGAAVETLIARLFGRADVDFLHAHFARRGCFAARIDRAH